MIVEAGQVVESSDNYVLVATAGRSACARCDAGGGCGGALMGRMLGDRLHVVRALSGRSHSLVPGDRVTIGLHESALVRGAAMAYLVPLAGLFLGLLGARWLFGAGDSVTVAGAVLGLVLGALAARAMARRAQASPAFHPVVLGREPDR